MTDALDILKQINDKMRELRTSYEKDRIDEILITRIAPMDCAYRIKYEDRWYLLVSKFFAEKLKQYARTEPTTDPYTILNLQPSFIQTIMGIPIRNDEEFAEVVFMNALQEYINIPKQKEKNGDYNF
jgi:hypothetical protein